MTAPALVALAHGSRDPRSAQTIKALVAEVRAHAPRPARRARVPRAVEAVVRDGGRPAGEGRLTTRSSWCRCCSRRRTTPRSTCPTAIAEATARHPGLRIRATRVLGPGVGVPRSARPSAARLAAATPGCVSSTRWCSRPPGLRTTLANQAVTRLARLWGSRHRLPTVAAYASAAPPATGEAVRQFRSEGRRHIAVGSLFLAPGMLPDRASRAGPRGRRRRGLRSTRRRSGAGAHRAGPLRRRSRGARPGLTATRGAPRRTSARVWSRAGPGSARRRAGRGDGPALHRSWGRCLAGRPRRTGRTRCTRRCRSGRQATPVEGRRRSTHSSV